MREGSPGPSGGRFYFFLLLQRRVIFGNPVFDFAAKLGCLDEDLLRFRLRRATLEKV